MNRLTLARVFAALLLLGEFCSVRAAEPKRGGTLRFGLSKNLTTLNPFINIQTVDHAVRSLLYEGLLAVDQNLDTLPALATSWTISSDGLTYTFQLRPGIQFHNGKPFTSSDLKWSIEYAQDPRNGATGRTDLTIIEKVDVEESGRVHIRLKSPYAPLLSAVAGMHVFPVVARESLQYGEIKRETFPAGTGPFRFSSWQSGQELRLQRFDGYWQKGLPYLEEVRFVIVTDDATRVNGVRAGDLDLAEEIPMEEMLRIREGRLPGIRLALAMAGRHARMGVNHCHPPLSDVRVRRALALALDKEEIIQGVFSGLGMPTNQKLLRGTKWFASEVVDRKQNLAKARSLLAEAGYPNGLKLTVASPPGRSEKLFQVVQSQARKAGIEMTIQIRDYAAHIAALGRGDFQLSMAGGATASDPDLTYYAYYHTQPADRRGRGGRTEPCYSNLRVDQLLEDARRVTDLQQRRRMYKEVIETLQEDVADFPLAFVPDGYAFQSYVRDFSPTITSLFSYGDGGVLKTWMDR